MHRNESKEYFCVDYKSVKVIKYEDYTSFLLVSCDTDVCVSSESSKGHY